MKLPQIRLQSQFAQIGLQQQAADIQIEQPKATQHIEQPQAIVDIRTTPSRLRIDQTQAWREMELKSSIVITEEAAQAGKQKVLQGIARRARQGDELMRIENDGQPLISQAVQNGKRPEKQFNIGWIPSPFAVKTDYQPSEVHINVTPQEPVIQNQPNKPVVHYQRGGVETYMLQNNALDIDFEHLYFKGVNFEMKL